MNHTLLFDNAQIYYWTSENAERPILLMLPGYSGTHRDFLHLAKMLEADYRLLIPDLPGWGNSAKLPQDNSLERYAQLIKSILEQEGAKEIYLCGHCMGATLALEVASKYPELIKKLLLVSPPYEEGVLIAERMRWLINTGNQFSPKYRSPFYFWRNRYFNFVLSFFVLKFKSFRKIVEVTIENFKLINNEDPQILYENFTSLVNYDYRKLRSLPMPVKLVFGARDILITPKQARKLNSFLKKPDLEFIKEAGHLPPTETPEELVGIMQKFFVY